MSFISFGGSYVGLQNKFSDGGDNKEPIIAMIIIVLLIIFILIIS